MEDMEKIIQRLAIQVANLTVENAKLAVMLGNAEEENAKIRSSEGTNNDGTN